MGLVSTFISWNFSLLWLSISVSPKYNTQSNIFRFRSFWRNASLYRLQLNSFIVHEYSALWKSNQATRRNCSQTIRIGWWWFRIATPKTTKSGKFLINLNLCWNNIHWNSQIYPPKLLERFKTCGNLNECLRQLNHNSKLAVAISREHVRIKHFLPHHYCFKNVEIIHDYALKFLIQKDFPYVKELNRFIATASASGLIEKWHKGKNLRYTDVEHEHIANLKMSFMFIFMIMSVSFLMLCLERLVHKKTHQPNPSWSWLTIQMIIDPYRRFWLKTKYLNGHPAY